MIIAVITDTAIGGTFLDWSLHYLSGATKHYNAHLVEYCPLVENPLTQKNAHGFKSNKSETLSVIEQTIENIKKEPSHNLYSFYFHNFSPTDEDKENKAVALSLLNCDKIVSLQLNKESKLFHLKIEQRDDNRLNAKRLSFDEYIKLHFDKSLSHYNENLDIWEMRELIALSYDFNIDMGDISRHNFYNQKKCYVIDSTQMWKNFDTEIFKLFEFLNIKINFDRYLKWLEVYQQWTDTIIDRVSFSDDFYKIVYYIENNVNYDLSKYKLDILQEAYIQQYFIKHKKKNFKIYGLEKFKNTSELHTLLEDIA